MERWKEKVGVLEGIFRPLFSDQFPLFFGKTELSRRFSKRGYVAYTEKKFKKEDPLFLSVHWDFSVRIPQPPPSQSQIKKGEILQKKTFEKKPLF